MILFKGEMFLDMIVFSRPKIVAPVLWIPNQLEGTVIGQQVSLICQIEAFPVPIVYWTTENGEIIIDSTKDLIRML